MPCPLTSREHSSRTSFRPVKQFEAPKAAKNSPNSISIRGFMPRNQKKNLKTSKTTQAVTSQTHPFPGDQVKYSQTSQSFQDTSPTGPLAGSSQPSFSGAQSNKNNSVTFEETKKPMKGSAIQATKISVTSGQSSATTRKERSVSTPIFDETMRRIEAQKQAHGKRERSRLWRARRESLRQTARARRQQDSDPASQNIENSRTDLASVLEAEPKHAHGTSPVDITPPPSTETDFAPVESAPDPSVDASMSSSLRKSSGGVNNTSEERTKAPVGPTAIEPVQFSAPPNEKYLQKRIQKRRYPRPDGEIWRAIFMALIAGVWFWVTVATSLGIWVLLFGVIMLNNMVNIAFPYLQRGLTSAGRFMKEIFDGFSARRNAPTRPLQSKMTLHEFRKLKLADRYSEEEYPGFKWAIRRSTHFSLADIDLLLLNTDGNTRIDREGSPDFSERLADNRWAVNYCTDVDDFLLLLQECIDMHNQFDAWQESNRVSR